MSGSQCASGSPPGAPTDYDIHGAVAAGLTPSQIVNDYATNPHAPYDAAAVRKAGVPDAEIVAGSEQVMKQRLFTLEEGRYGCMHGMNSPDKNDGSSLFPALARPEWLLRQAM